MMKRKAKPKTMEPDKPVSQTGPDDKNPVVHKNLLLPGLRRSSRQTKLQALGFMAAFAVVGLVLLFQSFAQGTSTISGTAFKDMNRNGVMDAGEEPMADQVIYLMGSDESFIGGVVSDSAGKYTFSGLADGNYTVKYSSYSWEQIWEQWVPTTVTGVWPTQQVALIGNAKVDFGWRPITQSTDVTKPTSVYTAGDGLRVEVFNDALPPQEINTALRQGTLIGQEAGVVTIRFALGTSSYCAMTSGGSFSATCYVSYRSWLSDWDATLFHEYGHAWEGFYSHRNEDPDLTGYLAARRLTGDSRLNSNRAWSPFEMIAEDYRQLFGSPNAASRGQENRDIPLAKDVPGLREYLSGEFINGSAAPPPTGLAAPTNLTATAQQSPEGPSVQLNWTASTGAVKYNIYRNNTKVGTANAPSTTFYDGTNLEYNKSYTYYVKAVDSNNNQSPESNQATVMTPVQDIKSPTAPSGLRTTSVSSSSVSLAWNAGTDNNPGTISYRVYKVGGRKGLTDALLTTTTNLTFTDSNLKAGSTQSYYVVAVDAAGNQSQPTPTLSVKLPRR
jgi:hypothetical protein